jgi:amino acid transporter
MKKTVLTFGLIAGAILSGMMLITLPFIDRIGFDRAALVGYTGMVAAFLLVFFGIRAHRDNQPDRRISFGRGFLVGSLITAVASVCYVATWQVVYYKLAPDFFAQYTAHTLEKERASGASESQVAAKAADMQKFEEMYRNPLVNAAVTFLEPLPVGLIVSLVSAGILRRRRRDPADTPAQGRSAGLSSINV